jgi:hypothetical protein
MATRQRTEQRGGRKQNAEKPACGNSRPQLELAGCYELLTGNPELMPPSWQIAPALVLTGLATFRVVGNPEVGRVAR